MRYPTRLACFVAALALLTLGSCKPPPEMVRVQETVQGPPDLTKTTPPTEADRAFQLHSFHLNQIWANAGDHEARSDAYRAKVTVWDYDDDSPLAELYFDDEPVPAKGAPVNPATAKRPYQVDFPTGMLMPILSTLRNTNEPVFLYYFRGRWAVGTYNPESVGSD